MVKDSKKLSRKRRKEVYDFLIKNVTYGLGVKDNGLDLKQQVVEKSR